MKEFTVRENTDLKTFTDNTYAQGSFWFRPLLKKRDIRVNGKKVDKNIPVYVGDVVSYYLPKDKEEKPAFYRVYEDENVLIVDKESGVNSEAVYAALQKEGARFIHRLDRNTKGLLVFAKTEEAEKELLLLFKERKVEKTYHAVVCGEVYPPHAILTAYLKKNAEQSAVKIYDDEGRGEKIVTEYTLLETKDGLSRLSIRLHTGKTHQIRAHTAHIGYPVLGDTKYGDERYNEKYAATRQFLVAKSLRVVSDGALAYLKDQTFFSRFDCAFPTAKGEREQDDE